MPVERRVVTDEARHLFGSDKIKRLVDLCVGEPGRIGPEERSGADLRTKSRLPSSLVAGKEPRGTVARDQGLCGCGGGQLCGQ